MDSSASYQQRLGPWRCFHCDEVFDTEPQARLHFGSDITCVPGCIERVKGGELGLLSRVRSLETELSAFYSETGAVETYVHGLLIDHRRDLIREEERGYDKGVIDGAKELQAALKRIDDLTIERDLLHVRLRAKKAESGAYDAPTMLL